MIVELTELEAPIGPMMFGQHAGALRVLCRSDHWDKQRAALQRRVGAVEFHHRANSDAACRMQAYFAGDLGALDGIAVAPTGTPFQQAVWTALRTIPVGQTVSYRELAQTIGKPAAVRAVGAANGANPIWIVIPCHRVIGADGSLVGYGAGIDRKRWLLDHERRYAQIRDRGSAAQGCLSLEPPSL